VSETAPIAVRTERLLLRPWRADDAALLAPVLAANVAHLSGWIPRHVWSPAPEAALADRLAGFAADFTRGESWRFGIFALDESDVYGEGSLFCRSADGRVPFGAGDCAEIGYWLRRDVTGRGYATESARALMDVAAALPGVLRIEIHCDARNAASVAVPGRLGFTRADAGRESGTDMVWVHHLVQRPEAAS
jgi:RimJ/RimL family protein N-acetyltransferase